MKKRGLELLRQATGLSTADFRNGQWEAVEALLRRERLLVVERTGWGNGKAYITESCHADESSSYGLANTNSLSTHYIESIQRPPTNLLFKTK